MEKPSPVYNFSSRFQTHAREDRSEKDRYNDRMMLRGIPVLRDTDEESSTTLWRGDHSFSSDAASYSLTHFIEPEVAKEHPGWSYEKVQQTAVERFEKRLRQDLSYEKKEDAHEESVVAWRPIQTHDGGWELATEYGDKMITLRELWEHTREYAAFAGNPAAYNKEEHQAQLVMQDKLIEGSVNGFVSVLSHPDSVRYVQVWQKADDGTITSKQVDIYKTIGRDFTHEEAVKFIDHLADFHHEATTAASDESASYAHFFIHRTAVREEDIRLIAVAQAMESAVQVAPERAPLQKIFIDTGGAVLRDTTESMLQLGGFLREQIDRKITAFRSMGEPVKKKLTRPEDIKISALKPGEHIAVLSVAEKTSDKKEAEKYPKEAHMSTETMKSAAAEWWISTLMLRHRESISVAPVAILFWLTSGRESGSAAAHVLLPEKKIAGAGELIAATLKKEKKKRVSMRSIFRAVKHFGEKKVRTKIRRMLPEELSGITLVSSIGKEGEAAREKVTRILPLAVMEKLMRMLRRFSRDLVIIHDAPTESRVLPRPEIFLQEGIQRRLPEMTQYEPRVRLLTRELSVAIIVWWLIDFGKDNPIHISDQLSETEELSADKSPVGKEAATEITWVLLAIIWYLSAIREHGKPKTSNKKKSGKKKTKQTNMAVGVPLPPSGVIFVYGS